MRVTACAIGLCLVNVPLARADDTCRAIMGRALEALGGEKKVAGFTGVTFKVKGFVDPEGDGTKKLEVGGTWSLRGIDRARWDYEVQQDGTLNNGTLLFNGKQGWLIGPDGRANGLPGEVAGAVLTNVRSLRLMQNPALLRGKGITLSPLGELKIGDRAGVGIKVIQKGHPDVDLVFDRKTGLPLRSEIRQKEVKDGQEVVHAFLYEGFKAFNGVQHFTRLTFLRNGNTHMKLELSDVNPQEKLDDGLFARPAKSP
jgi:hypothetical protein